MDRLPTTLDELRAAVDAGRTFTYLSFWGHQPGADGRVGPSCLSQFYPAPFTVDGVTYATAEHWMMAGKARLFGDDDALEDILSTPDPGTAKRIGRRVRDFDEEAWGARRQDLVVQGNVEKFRQNPELLAFLLSTAGKVLVEASPRDRVWGIGMGAKNPDLTDPHAWRGQNLLGFALMVVRDRLAAQEP